MGTAVNKTHNILALVDGSAYSRSVVEHAAWAAMRQESKLTIVHILGRREAGAQDLSGNIGLGARTKLLEEMAELDAQKSKLAQLRGRAILEDADALARASGVDQLTTKLRHGDLIEALRDLEADQDLIVIGKRGEAADFAKLHLGSNLERVVRAATRPVLVAARAFRPINRVLIAFDGGKSALKAVDHLSRAPLYTGLSFRVLHVGPDNTGTRRTLDGAVAQLRGAGHTVDSAIVQGEPDQVIADTIQADGFDMLVMGAYGHSRIRNLIIGSTTEAMIRNCLVPVFLYR